MRIWHCAPTRAILRCPLIGASGTLGQFPLIVEKILEEVVAPLRRCRGPGDFQATADGVGTVTFAKFIFPSDTLKLYFSAFWFRANVISRNCGTVSFAEGMPAGNQRN